MALTELDRQLLHRCFEHEPAAWNEFVDRFTGLLVHVIHHTAHARSLALRPEDVEDVCAEIMLQLVADNYAALRRFRGSSSLATYLTVIARRIAVRELIRRHFAAELGHVSISAPIAAAVAEAAEPQRRIENREEVARMLEGLDRKEADIVRMYHLEGMSYREISTTLNVPENSIGPTLHRSFEKLRRLLQTRSAG